MSKQEIDLLISYLKPEYTMLEWGSGGSTVTFQQYVDKYYSIEHNKEWFEKVDVELGNRNLKHKVHNYFVEQNAPKSKPSRYEEFKDYIELASTLNTKFNAVLVDGRARPHCALYAYHLLEDDGVVFIHDYFVRPHYHFVEDKYRVVAGIRTGQTLAVLKKKH
jgi:hypothetical protein